MATRTKSVLVLACVAIALGAGVYYWLKQPGTIDPKVDPQRAFTGSSELLKQTDMVPTLNSPIAENRSAVWCISLQLAWNRLKNDIVKEPIKLEGAQQTVHRLNDASFSDDDVPVGEYLAVAGAVNEGIVEKIQADLTRQFPDNTMPPIKGIPGGYVAVGYLKASVRYQYQFFNSREWFSFTQGDGRRVLVRSFGLPEYTKGHPIEGECRDQVRVLFREGGQFAIDLSQRSTPNQVILAKVPWSDTLAATLAEVNNRIDHSWSKPLPATASLLVPNHDWRIEHSYRDLEGNAFLNPGMQGRSLIQAFQFVDFKMDRLGAAVESGAILGSDNGHTPPFDPNPDRYHFDQPFLIIMKKREAKNPFFVMWVDNAELLCKP